MIDDIKLPALPNDSETPASSEWQWSDEDMRDYALAAIKYDRQRRGDPVAYAVFADNGNIRIWQHEPLDWPEAVPLYSAPQPPAPAQELSDDDLHNLWSRSGGVMRTFARALLARYGSAQPSVPDGWQLVPIKPNNPMEAAAEDYWNGLRYSAFSKSPRTWADVYGSMLAAAPKFGEEE